MAKVWREVTRMKTMTTDYILHTEWTQALSAIDLLGIGTSLSLPLGVYILIPYCAKFIAGPSCVISVLLAFVVALLAGMHTVELACTMSKSCLLYQFVYGTMGEVWAFLLAWITLLDYGIASSFVAKQWSQHFNFLFNSSVHPYTLFSLANKGSTIFEENFDLMAFIGLILASLLIAMNLRVAGTVTLILATVCTLVVSSCILVGFFYANTINWTNPGFFQNGYLGALKGASFLLYGFIGWEALTYLLEEVPHSEKRLPVLVPLCNFVLTVYFFLLSLSITLALDVAQFPTSVMLPNIFGKISVPASRYVLSVGSACGLSATLISALIPASRVLRTLGVDRLVCAKLGALNGYTGAPCFALTTNWMANVLLLMVKSETLLHILRITIPLRLLVSVVVVILQRFCAFPVGLQPEVANYRNFNRHKSRSFVASGDSLNSTRERRRSLPDTSVDEEGSMTSSFICKNIAILQMGSQSFLPTVTPDPEENADSVAVHERSSLLENGTGVHKKKPVRSVSRYSTAVSEVGRCVHEHETTSLHSVSLGAPSSLVQKQRAKEHDCLKSPCSPGSHAELEDPFYHLYERFNPQLPYYSHTSGYSKSSNPCTQSQTYFKAYKLLIVYFAACFLFGIFLVTLSDPLNNGTVWVLGLMLIPLIPLGILVWQIGKLDRNFTTSIRKHRVPIFPYLSLLTGFLLAVLLCAGDLWAFGKLCVWCFIGLVFYLSYGRRLSMESRGAPVRQMILENPLVADDAHMIRSVTAPNSET